MYIRARMYICSQNPRDDPLNVGRVLKELFAVMHPNQQRIYCHTIKNKGERRVLDAAGFGHVLFRTIIRLESTPLAICF